MKARLCLVAMKFSIIIPAFNEESYLPATLGKINESLADFRELFEVIVVDNASGDKTAQIAADFGAKVVSELEHNIAKVRNSGAKTANGDSLIFIDADTFVSSEVLVKIAETMKDENCFGGVVAVDYQQFQRKWVKFYLRGWTFWEKVFNMKQGAAQFCRKTVFHAVGGYDENIYMGEDVEFYWRLSEFAAQNNGYLAFIENPKVVTSARRFDKMSVWKILLLTHPFFIFLTMRKKRFWRDWYDKAVR